MIAAIEEHLRQEVLSGMREERKHTTDNKEENEIKLLNNTIRKYKLMVSDRDTEIEDLRMDKELLIREIVFIKQHWLISKIIKLFGVELK